MTNAIYEEAKVTAQKIRKALKEAFPSLPASHFKVNSKSYTGGSSVTVSWQDTPSVEAVEAITSKFKSAEMDSMQDYKEVKGYVWEDGNRYYGADFIFTRKDYTLEHAKKIREIFLAEYGEGFELNPRLCEEICAKIEARQTTAPKAQETKPKKPEKAPQGLHVIEGGKGKPVTLESLVAAMKAYVQGSWLDYPRLSPFTEMLATAYLKQEKNPSVEGFVQGTSRYVHSFVALDYTIMDIVDRGYELEYPLSLEQYANFASKHPINRPHSRDAAIATLFPIVVREMGDAFRPIRYTNDDRKMLDTLARAILEREPRYTATLAEIKEEQLIPYKRLDGKLQADVTYQFLAIELERRYTARMQAKSVQLDEKGQLRMERLVKLVTAAREVGRRLPGQFKPVNNVLSFITVTKTGVVLVVNPFGLFADKQSGAVALIERTQSDSFACFDGMTSKLMSHMELSDAKLLSDLTLHAFDLRRKV